MIFIFFIILTVYSLSNLMIARKLLQWLQIMVHNISPRAFYLIFTLCALSVIFMFFSPSNLAFRKYITYFAYHWMGVFFYLFLTISIASILLGIGFRFNLISPNIQNRVIFITGWIIFFIISSTLIYGRINATNLKVKSYELHINKQSELDHLTIALISDTHFGLVNGERHFKKIIDKINNLNPDIVCIAGDIFDGDFNLVENPTKMLSLLDSIQSKYGVYACLGNHDAGISYSQMAAFLESSSVKVLYDEFTVIENQFIIGGRRDSSPIGNHGEKRAELSDMNEESKYLPVILLDHQPSNINEYGTEIDLVLCGHTHRGQMFPANLITNAIFDVDYGYYQKDQKSPQIIVSSGAATWGPPFRIGSHSEVVYISVEFNREAHTDCSSL